MGVFWRLKAVFYRFCHVVSILAVFPRRFYMTIWRKSKNMTNCQFYCLAWLFWKCCGFKMHFFGKALKKRIFHSQLASNWKICPGFSAFDACISLNRAFFYQQRVNFFQKRIIFFFDLFFLTGKFLWQKKKYKSRFLLNQFLFAPNFFFGLFFSNHKFQNMACFSTWYVPKRVFVLQP